MKGALAAHRCQHDRRFERLVEQGCLEANVTRVDHAHRPQVDILEGAPIRRQGFVAIGSRREVTIVSPRQPVLRGGMEVEDIQRFFRRVDQVIGQLQGIEGLLGQQSPERRAPEKWACRQKREEPTSRQCFHCILRKSVSRDGT